MELSNGSEGGKEPSVQMKLTRILSPNHEKVEIPVEFLVLHYTGGSFRRALDLLTNAMAGVSAHLLISEEGAVFELVPCWDGQALRAWHSGASAWFDGIQQWSGLNECSIGIEIVNFNGNLIPYTEQQYNTLMGVIMHLKTLYPALRSVHRVLGHEHISGWRGKADPGSLFDWDRVFMECYPDQEHPERPHVCPEDLRVSMGMFLGLVPADEETAVQFWHAVNHVMETSVRLQQELLRTSRSPVNQPSGR